MNWAHERHFAEEGSHIELHLDEAIGEQFEQRRMRGGVVGVETIARLDHGAAHQVAPKAVCDVALEHAVASRQLG